MHLNLLETEPDGLRAGYECPCGCRPVVTYRPDADPARDDCCCGNVFAVGRFGGARLHAREGFTLESHRFVAPWGEPLEAAWLIGPSTHDAGSHDHAHEEDTMHSMRPLEMAHGGPGTAGQALDPVCGMTVDPEAARAAGRHSEYMGVEYFFCSRGCKLDFDEEPERYLDPSYEPSM